MWGSVNTKEGKRSPEVRSRSGPPFGAALGLGLLLGLERERKRDVELFSAESAPSRSSCCWVQSVLFLERELHEGAGGSCWLLSERLAL